MLVGNGLFKRMKERGRDDDIRFRKMLLLWLDWFETDVVPALDFYRAHKSHKFHEIKGEQEISKVAEEIPVFNRFKNKKMIKAKTPAEIEKLKNLAGKNFARILRMTAEQVKNHGVVFDSKFLE